MFFLGVVFFLAAGDQKKDQAAARPGRGLEAGPRGAGARSAAAQRAAAAGRGTDSWSVARRDQGRVRRARAAPACFVRAKIEIGLFPMIMRPVENMQKNLFFCTSTSTSPGWRCKNQDDE